MLVGVALYAGNDNLLIEAGGPEWLTWAQIADIIGTKVGRKVRVLPMPAWMIAINRMLATPFSPAAANMFALMGFVANFQPRWESPEVVQRFGLPKQLTVSDYLDAIQTSRQCFCKAKYLKNILFLHPTTEVSQMVLTRAKQSDIEGLVELLKCLFEQEAEFQPNPDLQRNALSKIILNTEVGVILVAKGENKILGMVNLLFIESTALGSRVAILEDMIVAAASRSQGIGSRLIDYAILEATHLGCKRITILTDSENIQAHDFYQKKGFTKSTMTPFRLLIN